MQGFTPPLEEQAACLRQDSDTATARTPIPILYIHSFAHPFCGHLRCACGMTQKSAAQLLGYISEGSLAMQEAAALIDEEWEGKLP